MTTSNSQYRYSTGKRTALTDERVLETAQILRMTADALEVMIKKRRSFRQLCKELELDERKVRRIIKVFDPSITEGDELPLSELDNLVYDGYEEFYRAVFGDKTVKKTKLPADYKESVKYVFANGQFGEKSMDAVKRKFAICEFEDGAPESGADIARRCGVSTSNVYNLISLLITRIRTSKMGDILVSGITVWKERNDSNKKIQNELIDHIKEKTDSVIVGIKTEAGEYISEDVNKTIHEVIMEISSLNIFSKDYTYCDVLNLSVRSYNALYRGWEYGTKSAAGHGHVPMSLYDLIMTSDKELLNFKDLGKRSFNEIREKIDKYMIEHYGITKEQFLLLQSAISQV